MSSETCGFQDVLCRNAWDESPTFTHIHRFAPNIQGTVQGGSILLNALNTEVKWLIFTPAITYSDYSQLGPHPPPTNQRLRPDRPEDSLDLPPKVRSARSFDLGMPAAQSKSAGERTRIKHH